MIHWVRRHHKKIRDIGVGLFVWETYNFFNDFIFYPFALLYWGLLKGGIIAYLATVIVNAFVFWLYEYMKVDWLAAHALRELEDKENKSHFEKLATWVGKKKVGIWEKMMSWVVFIGLLLPIDPVIVAIHYRRNHFSGLGWRDWGIFFLADAIAQAWWLIKVGVVVEGALYLWRHFPIH
jgi:hypothetical protein